ncbi:MAG: transglutaminase-like cysteine peptidase [Rickettsiales bacterium]
MSNKNVTKFSLLALCCLMMSAIAPEAASANVSLFGTRETMSNNISPFVKWTGLLAKEPVDRERMRADCNRVGPGCMYNQWEQLISKARTLPRINQLSFINREMNRGRYIVDPENWGREDYWESVYEFLMRDGDCEDFAIAKYMTLKEVGVPPEDMRIVILQDYNLNLMHAVLAVTINGINYILDNQLQQVVRDTAIHHYEPIYSINEKHWWRHLPY